MLLVAQLSTPLGESLRCRSRLNAAASQPGYFFLSLFLIFSFAVRVLARPLRACPPARGLGRDGNPWSAGWPGSARAAGALCTKTNVLRRRSRYLS
jgi:hypothetical protein